MAGKNYVRIGGSNLRDCKDLTQAGENFRNIWAVKPREYAAHGQKESKGSWNLSLDCWEGMESDTVSSVFTGYPTKLAE